MAAVRGRFVPCTLNSYLCNSGVCSLLVALIDFYVCHNFGRDFFFILFHTNESFVLLLE